jgi:hypothetical protein
MTNFLAQNRQVDLSYNKSLNLSLNIIGPYNFKDYLPGPGKMAA